MTENNSKYNFRRPSRTEQCNRPVTQNSQERWPENWEEKFCKLRNVWSQHTKLREKQLRAGGTTEVNISNKKKEFLDYLLHKKEKEQSSHKCEKTKENEQSSSHTANTEDLQHEEEEEEEDKVDLKKSEEEIEESEEESSSDQVEETEETCEEKMSSRSTKCVPRLRSGSQSKCSKVNSKKVRRKKLFDERQYIKDLKHLHNNIETFLHQSSTYLDESCSKKQKIPNPYIKNCYLEGYNGPFLAPFRKSVDPSVSQLGFINMPDHPVQEQLSGKQLEKLSLYNAPNIEIYGNCGDVNCPFSDDFSGKSKKSKPNKNYSYCDNQLNLKLNNFRYEQVCHQTPKLYRCCTCPHHNTENIKQKKGSPKQKLNKQRISFEGESNSDQSDININTQKLCCECKKLLEQSAPKSIKSTKSNEFGPPKTKSKRSVKSDKICDDRSSKKSTKSSKSLRGILKECCDVEEKSVENLSIKPEKSVSSIKPAESVISIKNDPVPDIKSENSDESVKATSKNDYKVACDSKKSSKHRTKTVKECCELDIKSDISIKLTRLKSNYHLQEKRSISPIKSNKSVKEIGKRSSSGSYESACCSAKQHNNEPYLREELVKKKSTVAVKNVPKKKKVTETSKCKCEGLKRGENLTPVNPKGIRRKKKHRKQEKKMEVDEDEDEESEPEISPRCTSIFPAQFKNVCFENEESRKTFVRQQFLKLYKKRVNYAYKQSAKCPKVTIKIRSKKYKNYHNKSSVHSKPFKIFSKGPNNLLPSPVLRSQNYKQPNLSNDYLLFPVIRKKCGQNNVRVSFAKSWQKNIYCSY